MWALIIKLCVKSCSQQIKSCRSWPGCCKYGSKTSLPHGSPGFLAKLMLEHYKPVALSPFCASSRVCCHQMAGISLTLSSVKLCAAFLALAFALTKTSVSLAFPYRGCLVPECGESFALLLGESRMGLPWFFSFSRSTFHVTSGSLVVFRFYSRDRNQMELCTAYFISAMFEVWEVEEGALTLLNMQYGTILLWECIVGICWSY